MAQGLYGNQAVGKWAQEALLHQPVTLSPERESTRNCSLMVLCVFARVRQGADYAVGLHFVLHLGFCVRGAIPARAYASGSHGPGAPLFCTTTAGHDGLHAT